MLSCCDKSQKHNSIPQNSSLIRCVGRCAWTTAQRKTAFGSWFSPSTLLSALRTAGQCGHELPGDSLVSPTHVAVGAPQSQGESLSKPTPFPCILQNKLGLSGLRDQCFFPLTHIPQPPFLPSLLSFCFLCPGSVELFKIQRKVKGTNSYS